MGISCYDEIKGETKMKKKQIEGERRTEKKRKSGNEQ
jgi:hypothetical protein